MGIVPSLHSDCMMTHQDRRESAPTHNGNPPGAPFPGDSFIGVRQGDGCCMILEHPACGRHLWVATGVLFFLLAEANYSPELLQQPVEP